MAPRYPRPTRRQPLQVGIFLAKANPLLMPTSIEILEIPVTGQYRPEFNDEDEVFLLKIGVRP